MNYYFNEDVDVLRKQIEAKTGFIKTRKTKQNCGQLMSLMKKLVINLPRKSVVFNVKKGKVYNKRKDKNNKCYKLPL